MKEAVIVDAVRTPIGKHAGALKDWRPDDLAAHVIKQIVARNGIDAEEIEDVILGCANQAGEDNRNVARMATLLANLPVTVAATTVNRLCGSGLEAINQAARSVQCEAGDLFVAGGVESMTRAPFVMGKLEAGFKRGNQTMFDTTLGWRFLNANLAAAHHPYAMGETAENVAERYKIDRKQQDAFAVESQRRWKNADDAGHFAAEIVPVPLPGNKDQAVFCQDEQPRPETNLESLSRLKPAFKEGGTVTAGNSSGINDGAAALLIMSAAKAKALGLTPLATVLSYAVAGVDPAYMGIGPVPACRKALERARLTVNDIDLVELNEAFAAQSLACIQELAFNPEKVNVNGGAIAIGHPIGCSGARIMTTLLHEMKRRNAKLGLATMCIGVGQGIATVVSLK
jgi:3-oxoadipyl-CoA thiolase